MRARLCWLNCSFYCILDLFSFVFAKFYSLWYKIKKENLHIFDFYIFFYIFFVYVILVYFSFFEVSENAGDQFRVFFAFFFCLFFSILKLLWGVQESFVEKRKKIEEKTKDSPVLRCWWKKSLCTI